MCAFPLMPRLGMALEGPGAVGYRRHGSVEKMTDRLQNSSCHRSYREWRAGVSKPDAELSW